MGDTATAEWSKAFETWLQVRASSTQRAYRRAHADLLRYTGRSWPEIQSGDVRGWLNDLRSRPLAPQVAAGLERCRGRQAGDRGLAPATICLYLAAVSSFYRFASERYLLSRNGREEPLFGGANPVRVLERPRPVPYGQASYLDVDQLRALLSAVRSEERRALVKARRDYALFLTLIATGGRSSEVRTLRWADLEWRAGAVYYRWTGKGRTGKDELGRHAWVAIEDYLRTAGRIERMRPQDYLFTPLCDRACRLPTVDPATWTTNRPLSRREVGRLMKFYAARAGLDPAGRHPHELRHSAYMLYGSAGLSLEERSRLLHHASLATTTRYDHEVAGQRNLGWSRAAALLGLG